MNTSDKFCNLHKSGFENDEFNDDGYYVIDASDICGHPDDN